MVVIFSTIWIRIFYENKKFLHFPRTPRFPSMSIPNSPNSSINLFSISRSAILVAIPLKFAKILSAVTTQVVFLYREGIYDIWKPILFLYLTGVHFRGELQHGVSMISKKSSVDQSELEKQVASHCQAAICRVLLGIASGARPNCSTVLTIPPCYAVWSHL